MLIVIGKTSLLFTQIWVPKFESKGQLLGTYRSPNKREFTQVCVGIPSKSQTKNVNIALVFEDAADAARLESTAAPLQDQSYVYQVLFWAVLEKLISIEVRKPLIF